MSAELALDAGEPTPPIRQLCRYLSERSPQPLVAVEGITHVVIYLNPAFARLVGRESKDLIGRPFAEAVPEGVENGCHSLLDRVFHSGTPEILAEQEHRQTQSKPVYWSYSVWAILGDDERPAGVMIQVTDVTETALFRRQSVAMNEKLIVSATQQHQLADEGRSLSSRLQTAVQTRDHFLAVLSHELRNPLAAIRNAVTVATRTGTREDLEWSRDVTARQVMNFAHLIDDLLDVSRVSQGKIQLRKEVVDVGSVLRHAVEAVRPLVDERKHELQLSFTDMRIEADTTRLEQMVVNLLANAAKYTPSQGRIQLIAGPEGDEFVCRVKDNGVGIPAELLPRMFDLFVQSDRSLARSEGGLGIGLTLVRSLAELHGGTITATSDGPDRGSEFVLRLPAAISPSAEESGPSGGPEKWPPQSLRILVVDDNEDTARGMAKLLRLSGHTVWVAHTGPDAIASAREHGPEAVILDIGLPGMDGYEVASLLRKEEGSRKPVIIAVSGYGEEQVRSHTAAASFDHHLVKPVNFDTLLSVIARRDAGR
jgi:PAS domain S-box-containing protein